MESSINQDRRIGVEVEFVLPILGAGNNLDVQQLLATVLSNHGMPAIARCYSRQPLPSGCDIAVEHDTSLRDETRYVGVRWARIELKTAPMTWQRIQSVLPQALGVVRYFGAKINASCGLHVHHCAGEVIEQPVVARNLQRLWWAYHHIFYGLVAPSRQNTLYCRPPRRTEVTMFDKARTYAHVSDRLASLDRYCGLNLLNLADTSRLTVEWRLHAGTTDWNKIGPWILATQRWTQHCIERTVQLRREPVPNSRRGLNALLITTGLKPNNRTYRKVEKELRQAGRYLLRRWRKFNPSPDMKKAVA
jgi:hypothetical protein